MLKNEREASFYNVVNLATQSNHRKLGDLMAKHRTWERVWQSLSSEEKGGVHLEDEWVKLEKKGVKLLLNTDNCFPSLLKEIPWAPFGIYYKGNVPDETTRSLC